MAVPPRPASIAIASDPPQDKLQARAATKPNNPNATITERTIKTIWAPLLLV